MSFVTGRGGAPQLKEDEMSGIAKVLVYLILSLFVVSGAKG